MSELAPNGMTESELRAVLNKRLDALSKAFPEMVDGVTPHPVHGSPPDTHFGLRQAFAWLEAQGAEVVWQEAIRIAKQPINTVGWGSASGGVAQQVIVKALESARSAVREREGK